MAATTGAAGKKRPASEAAGEVRDKYFEVYHSTMKALIMASEEGALPEGHATAFPLFRNPSGADAGWLLWQAALADYYPTGRPAG